jgi:uncharacterized protein (TIGR03545 family)
MRKRFIIVALVPLLLLAILLYFFLDRWTEAGLEYAAEDFVGTRVEIDNLSISFSPLGLRFTRLQVASPDDPWKNLLETGPVRFTMDAGQLLRGKYIIETMEIESIVLGTKRTRDGSLPGRQHATSTPTDTPPFSTLIRQVLEKTVEKTPLFDPALLRGAINIDSLVRAQNFQTLALLDTLRARTARASHSWDSTLASFEVGKKRLQEIETGIRAIHPQELKTPDRILSAITTVDGARKTVSDLTGTFTQRQAELRTGLQGLATSVGTIDESVRKDYQYVLSLARLPDVDATGLAELLLGQQLLTKAESYARWIDMARAEAAKYAPEPSMETPPRLKGQDIHFPAERGYPRYWIKHVQVSGGTDPTQNGEVITLRGVLTNLSSDQRVTGEPMTATLEGRRATSMTMTLAALIDRRKEVPLDQYRVEAQGIPLAAFELGKSDFLPSKISDAMLHTAVTVTVPGSSFDAQASLDFRNMRLEFDAEPRNLGERLAHSILSGVKGFDAGLHLWKKDGGVDVAFTTDLDEQFAGGITTALGAELTKLQNEIRTKVEAAVAAKRQEFEALYARKRDEVQKQLEVYQTLINEKTALLENTRKELEARLEKEKKGALDNLLKGVLKK